MIMAKIKVMPDGDLQIKYDRYMKTFWSLYAVVFEKSKTKLNPKTFVIIQKKMMNDVRFFLSFYHILNYISCYFSPLGDDYQSYYERLFMDDTKDKNRKIIIKEFIANRINYVSTMTFTELEQSIIELLIPGDITMRYLFGDKE